MSGTSTRTTDTPAVAGIAVVVFGFIAAMLTARGAGNLAVALGASAGWGRQWVHAIVTSAIVVPLVLALWTRIDGRRLVDLGVPGGGRALRQFLLGATLIAGGFVLVVAMLVIQDDVTFNPSGVAAFLAAGAIAFFFEALPEELAFRGYVYRSLSIRTPRWAASLATIALFVLTPVLLVTLESALGFTVLIGGAASITGGYIITLILFGTFMQYLRVLTGTIWAGVGFHLAFRMLDRVVAPHDGALFLAGPGMEDGPAQAVLMAWLLLAFVGVVAYPFVTRRRLGWGERNP